MTRNRWERILGYGGINTIKWGSRDGRHRYHCKDCVHTFTSMKSEVTRNNRFIWFEWWILRHQPLKEISEMSGHYSGRDLRAWFDEYLERYPE